MEINGGEWFESIYNHYGRTMVTPVHAAAEILLGTNDAEKMAEAINQRGREVGDADMEATTAADCADAVEELKNLGLLVLVFAAASSVPGAPIGCEEHVLELRLPRAE